MIHHRPITVSVVEDTPDTRENLLSLLSRDPGLRCLGSYATGEAALQGIPAEKPNVVLMDINLPGMSGIQCVAKLRLKLPDLQILMLTTYNESDLIFRALRAGAHGYILKSAPHAELVQAIEQVCAGGGPLSMQVARKLITHFHQAPKPIPGNERLSQREEEVLTLLAKGHRYKEIGDSLNIAMSTVRTHLKHIYEKLHVQSRTEAAMKFLKSNQGAQGGLGPVAGRADRERAK